MNWTTEFPTKPGFYWMRKDVTHAPIVVEVNANLEVRFTGCELLAPRAFALEAEWQGPIKPQESTDQTREGLDMGRRVAYGTRVAVKVTEIKRLSEMMSLACIETAPAENSEPEAYFCIYEYSMPVARRTKVVKPGDTGVLVFTANLGKDLNKGQGFWDYFPDSQ